MKFRRTEVSLSKNTSRGKTRSEELGAGCEYAVEVDILQGLGQRVPLI
jgi:hypothetical protein